VPRDLIIEDYHLSEHYLAPNLDKLRRYFHRIGLSKEEFILAPRNIMVGLLAYLDRIYGSICKYLEHIGFTLEEQDQLRDTLLMRKEDAVEESPHWQSYSESPLPSYPTYFS